MTRRRRVVLFGALNVAAVATANLLAGWLGPWVTVPDAFLLIGLAMVTRDVLHEEAERWPLVVGAVIALGGVVSYAVSLAVGSGPIVGQIATGSFVAFVASQSVDTTVYEVGRRRGWEWFVRSNASNLPAAAVDSILFPLIAFGGILPWVVAGQFAAKVGGGLVWSLILRRSGDPARGQGAPDASPA